MNKLIKVLVLVQLLVSETDSRPAVRRIGNCTYTSKADPVDNDDVGSFSSRAYPYLNCSIFNKTFWRNYSFADLKIRGFLLTNNQRREFNVQDLAAFPTLQTVELHKVELATNISAASITNTTSLSITKCGLTFLPSKILRIFPNLMKVAFSRNDITSINNDSFKSSQKLKSVDLSHNLIKVFNNQWLNDYSSIESLTLKAIGLTNIDKLFRNARYLKFLDLSHNSIKTLHEMSFRHASNLTALILANNEISYIRERFFKGAFNLKFIDLTQNNLRKLNDGLFEFLPSNELTVELWENPINCNCSLKWLSLWIKKEKLFGNFPDIQLSCQDPSRNHGLKFSSAYRIPPRHLTCLSSDKPWSASDLCISEKDKTKNVPNFVSKHTTVITTPNPLFKCPDDCSCYSSNKDLPLSRIRKVIRNIKYPLMVCESTRYRRIPKLGSTEMQTILMIKSNWETLDVGNLRLPQSLKYLYLVDCNITQLIPNKIIFNSLTGLFLQDNQISSISKQFLSSFPQLSTLTLSNNKISHFGDDIFLNNRQLKRLSLGPNPAEKRFSGNCLAELNSLTHLFLRGMNLLDIPVAIQNKQNMVNLDLSNNIITMVRKSAFFNSTKLFKISLENNNISTVEKGAFRNLPNLGYLDISENNLETLPVDLLSDDYYNLENIELWQNPIRCDCHLRNFMILLEKTVRDNPSIEVRFRCEEPLKMRGKTSDKTDISEFVCEVENELTVYTDWQRVCVNCTMEKLRTEKYQPEISDQPVYIYSKQNMTMAVLLTILLCVLFFIGVECLLCRRYKRRRQCKTLAIDQQWHKFDALTPSLADDRAPIVDEDNQLSTQ